MLVMDDPKTATSSLKNAHILFIDAYILTKNATKAAIAAGYSTHSAGKAGYRLIHDPRIKAAIERKIEAEKAEIAGRQARKQLLSFSKDDFIHESLKNYKEAEEARDRARFLELAGKAQGYLSSDINVNMNIGMFANAQRELASLPADTQTIRAELAPPTEELKVIDAPQPQAQTDSNVNGVSA